MRPLGRAVGCLVVLCAAAALAAGPASAAPPEFTPPFPKPFKSSSKTTVLETVAKVRVKCAADSGEGEITSEKTGTIKLRLTGCESKTIPCNSPNGVPGEIATPVLGVTLGYIRNTPEPKEVGIDISSPTGALVMEFMCGAALRAIVQGSVIGKITPINKTVNPPGHFVLKFAQKAGHQNVQHFEGGPPDFLETSFGGPFEPTGLSSTEVISFPIPVMIVA